MTISLTQVNLGVYPNDGTGDDLRTAFEKVNSNFFELSTQVNISNGVNLGQGAHFFKDRNVDTLEFKTLTSNDNSIVVTENGETVDLSMATMIMMDPNPMLGNNLDLNGFYVFGGDIQTSVFGVNIPIMNGILELLIESNQYASIDFGSILQPAGSKVSGDKGTILDMGFILDPFANNNLNFGVI